MGIHRQGFAAFGIQPLPSPCDAHWKLIGALGSFARGLGTIGPGFVVLGKMSLSRQLCNVCCCSSARTSRARRAKPENRSRIGFLSLPWTTRSPCQVGRVCVLARGSEGSREICMYSSYPSRLVVSRSTPTVSIAIRIRVLNACQPTCTCAHLNRDCSATRTRGRGGSALRPKPQREVRSDQRGKVVLKPKSRFSTRFASSFQILAVSLPTRKPGFRRQFSWSILLQRPAVWVAGLLFH